MIQDNTQESLSNLAALLDVEEERRRRKSSRARETIQQCQDPIQLESMQEACLVAKFLHHRYLDSPPTLSSILPLRKPPERPSRNLAWSDRECNKYMLLVGHPETDPHLHSEHESVHGEQGGSTTPQASTSNDLIVDATTSPHQTVPAKQMWIDPCQPISAEQRKIESKQLGRMASYREGRREFSYRHWSISRMEARLNGKKKPKEDVDKLLADQRKVNREQLVKDPNLKAKVATMAEIRRRKLEDAGCASVEKEEEIEGETEEELVAFAEIMGEAGEEGQEDDATVKAKGKGKTNSKTAQASDKETNFSRISRAYPTSVHARTAKHMLRQLSEQNDPTLQKPLLATLGLSLITQLACIPSIAFCLDFHLNTSLYEKSVLVACHQDPDKLKALIIQFCRLLTVDQSETPQELSQDLILRYRQHLKESQGFKDYFPDPQARSRFADSLPVHLLRRSKEINGLDPVMLSAIEQLVEKDDLPLLPSIGAIDTVWDDAALKWATNFVTSTKEDMQRCIRRDLSRRFKQLTPTPEMFPHLKKAHTALVNVATNVILDANFGDVGTKATLPADLDVRLKSAIRNKSKKISEAVLLTSIQLFKVEVLLPALNDRDNSVRLNDDSTCSPRSLLSTDPMQMLSWYHWMQQQQGKVLGAAIVCFLF